MRSHEAEEFRPARAVEGQLPSASVYRALLRDRQLPYGDARDPAVDARDPDGDARDPGLLMHVHMHLKR